MPDGVLLRESLRIPGRTFPVDSYFSKTAQEDYEIAVVKQALQMNFNSPPGHMISFMMGQEDIESTHQALAKKMDKLSDWNDAPSLLVLPM
mmetsp:Transcript_51123/g.153621  ORF Transcript_51123/g.153621 Transcript_51123/m.153621 type:complete len:91 (-) Transcript_51123:84-356(-)